MYDSGLESVISMLLGFSVVFFVLIVAIAVVTIIAQWKMFQKAGRPGWAAIVPFYNGWVLYEIVWGKGWWFFAWAGIMIVANMIPFIGWLLSLACSLIFGISVAKAYGQPWAFGIGIMCVPFVFYLMLAFGKAQYIKPFSPWDMGFDGWWNDNVTPYESRSGMAQQVSHMSNSDTVDFASLSEEEQREAFRKKMEERHNQ